MSKQAIIDTAKSQIVAYNDKDWDAVDRILAADVEYDEIATHRDLHGKAEVVEAWRGWAKAFPDSKATFEREVVSGDHVVLEMTWRGTHKGPLQTPDGTIAATNKPIELRACQVVDVAGDKVQVIHHYFDMATMLEQLGVNR